MAETGLRQRKPMRWAARDYGLPGAYFVTICTAGRRYRFGEIVHQDLRWTPLGRCAHEAWTALPLRFPGVRLGTHVVMPNHVHGIVLLDPPPPVPPDGGSVDPRRTRGSAHRSARLPDVIGAYKSIVALTWARLRGTCSAPASPLWQRGFWDRVLRDSRELERATRYIDENVASWGADPLAVPEAEGPPPPPGPTSRTW